MKNIYFMLFVIAIMTTASSNAQNNVEEHQTIIDQVRTGNTIRFTLEVEKDSALCLPQIKQGECYVTSQKFKKYVYVDISQAQNIEPDHAVQIFKKAGYWVDIDHIFGRNKESSLPDDFKKIKLIWRYSGFPWLNVSLTDVKGRYYGYDNKSIPLQIRTKTELETASYPAVYIYVIWIAIIVLVLMAIRSDRRGKFISVFSGDLKFFTAITSIVLTVIMYFGHAWFYASLYLVTVPIVYYLLPLLIFGKEEIPKDDHRTYKSQFYLLFNISSLLQILFWTVHHRNYCYVVLPTTIFSLCVMFFLYRLAKMATSIPVDMSS